MSSWVQENRNYGYENEGKFQRHVTFKSIICNKTVKGWIFITLFAISVPVLLYYFLIDQADYQEDDSYTCLVSQSFRVPCGIVNISSSDCTRLNCCYDRSTKTCYHYLPSRYSYNIDKKTQQYVPAQSKTPFGTTSTPNLQITVNEKDENRVSIILTQDDSIMDHQLDTEKNYEVKLLQEKLIAEIYRTEGDLLLTTAKGPVIASDTYWEWSFYLTNHSLFGLDRTLIDVATNETYTKVIYKNHLDHSTVPVLWAYSNNKFHGVVIRHEGSLEITILPSNLVLLKSLTGGSIELEVSVGPTPKLLHDQQAQKTDLLPMWAMQTHLCRKGSNTNLTELLADYNLNSQLNSDCLHENLVMAIMNDNNTNLQATMDTIKSIKEQGSYFLLSIPPHVLQNSYMYNKSVELDILFKYNNSAYSGTYLDRDVGYPDYSHSQIQSYIEEFVTSLSSYIDLNDIDGFVLHDNWPTNENYTMNTTHFPYLSKELQEAMSYTIPWNATNSDGTALHVENHNSYADAQVQSYLNHFGNSTVIISASQTYGRTEPVIMQNVNASWANLQMHVDNVLFRSISGNHLVSFPVCGDTTFYRSAVQETLCLRWYLVAATMPLFRLSSPEPWREPEHLNTVFAQGVALDAMDLRNKLLSFYYTILSRNEPVIRPMFYDYYQNETTFSMGNQYMIDDFVLVAHPFSENRNRLQVYLPSVKEIWYEIWGGALYNSTDDPWVGFSIVETDFIAFIAQGNILPLKDEDVLNLIIALNCSTSPCEATGTLFDTNNYITFLSDETTLTINDLSQENCNYTLGNINLYYYDNDTIVNHFFKNESLCTGETNITILF